MLILKPKEKINYKTLLFFIFIISPIFSYSQKKDFTLKVHFDNPYAKTLFIGEAYPLKPYCSATFKIDSANTTDNDYIFKGSILYPTAVRLMSYSDSLKFNQLIFIDTGYQEINIVKVNNKFIVRGNSAIENEHKLFLQEMDIKEIDKKIEGEKLLSYIEANPNSYVGFFSLINQTFNFKYSPIFSKVTNAFSKKIKQTKSFQYFISQYAPNKKISNYLVFNDKKKPVQLNFVNKENKYTLLEFWFKGCIGCLEQLQEMKASYSESLRKKLTIISINTSPKELFNESLLYIKKQNISWKNYWDYDEESIKKYTDIYIYPSNLLINSSGKIVGKDLDFSTINEFLD